LDPLSQTDTEGGGNGASHIDKTNMDAGPFRSKAGNGMPAMRSVQGRVSFAALNLPWLREKKFGPARGESGAKLQAANRLRGGTDADPREEEEKVGAVDGGCMVEGTGQQPRVAACQPCGQRIR
jgi:hypothetical protein